MVPRWLGGAACAGALLVAGCGGAPTGSAGSIVVARVGSTAITQAKLQLRLQSTLTSIAQGGGSTSNPAMQTSVRAAVLRSLILDTVIAQEAAKLNRAATDAQVQAQIQADARAVGSMTTLESQLAQAGGSVAQLQDELRAQLNEQRVEDYFAQQRADEVEHQLAAGTPFATVARAVSDDLNTASKGGDLGTVTTATLAHDDPRFARAVESLAVGRYTTTPVHDQGGYDVVLVYGKGQGTWKVRHIMVAAPTPYTVTGRPAWFSEALFSTVQQLCDQKQIHVYISDAGANPCTAAASPAPASNTPAPGSPRPSP